MQSKPKCFFFHLSYSKPIIIKHFYKYFKFYVKIVLVIMKIQNSLPPPLSLSQYIYISIISPKLKRLNTIHPNRGHYKRTKTKQGIVLRADLFLFFDGKSQLPLSMRHLLPQITTIYLIAAI